MTYLHGIDIAHDNGLTHIPLAQDFGMVKSTESTNYINSNHPAQVAALRKAGKLVGHYHFAHYNVSPDSQVDYFLSHTTIEPGDLIALDMEEMREDADKKDITDYELVVHTTLRWLGLIKKELGCSPMFYSFPYYIGRMRKASSYPWADLTAYPLWIAEYNGTDQVAPSDMFGWSVWTMHQNADQPYVDRDVFNGTASTWTKLAVPARAVKTPVPPPSPTLTVTVSAPKGVKVVVKNA